MQITHRLPRAWLHGHRTPKEVVTPFGEFNAEMRGEQAHMAGASIIDRRNAEPDCHRYPTVRRGRRTTCDIFRRCGDRPREMECPHAPPAHSLLRRRELRGRV